MGGNLRIRAVRAASVGGCLAGAIWVLASCTELGWGTTEARFRWLLRRDGWLLAAREQPSWLDRWTLTHRRHQLDRAYRSFIAEHPAHARAKVAYGCFLYDHDRQEEALHAWQDAINTDPALAVAYNNLAEHYAHHGRIEQAFAHYDRALELEPQRPIFHYNWAILASQQRRVAGQVYGWDRAAVLAESLTGFRRARDLEPANLFYAQAYAEGYRYLAEPDWEGAYAAWKFCLGQKAVDEVTQQRIYGRLARVCQRMRRFDEAETWLGKMKRKEVVSMRVALQRKQSALIAGHPDPLPLTMRAGVASGARQPE